MNCSPLLSKKGGGTGCSLEGRICCFAHKRSNFIANLIAGCPRCTCIHHAEVVVHGKIPLEFMIILGDGGHHSMSYVTLTKMAHQLLTLTYHLNVVIGHQKEIMNLTFIVFQMEFDKTRWSCPWNSDQNCTQNSARGW